MILMDIAALSMNLSQMKVAQEASMSVMKMAMETAESDAAEMIKMMEQSVVPNVGSNIDISL